MDLLHLVLVDPDRRRRIVHRHPTAFSFSFEFQKKLFYSKLRMDTLFFSDVQHLTLFQKA